MLARRLFLAPCSHSQIARDRGSDPGITPVRPGYAPPVFGRLPILPRPGFLRHHVLLPLLPLPLTGCEHAAEPAPHTPGRDAPPSLVDEPFHPPTPITCCVRGGASLWLALQSVTGCRLVSPARPWALKKRAPDKKSLTSGARFSGVANRRSRLPPEETAMLCAIPMTDKRAAAGGSSATSATAA